MNNILHDLHLVTHLIRYIENIFSSLIMSKVTKSNITYIFINTSKICRRPDFRFLRLLCMSWSLLENLPYKQNRLSLLLCPCTV